MVTGDSILTATHIAKECGILQGDGLVMEGREFRAMTDEQRNHILPKLQVLARSTPSDKFILVHRLRCLGEVVAVTGDGTNDAPALREADVGLSMGLAGTEVAKEASDIVILDDNFSSIVKAVLWGRSVYENIRKFLQFQLTANFAALAVVFVAALAQRDLPLTAVQLLWVNLIMDTLAALALATEPPMPELLERKPYGRYDPLISSIMYRNIVGQSLFQVATVLSIMFAAPVVLDMEPDSRVVTTICFNTFVWCQLFNEFNARRINESDRWNTNVFQGLWPTRSPLFCLIWLSTAAAQVIIVQYGGAATQTTALSLREWVFCLAVGKLSLPLGMLLRTIRVRPRSEAVPKDIVEARKRAYGEEEYDERQRLLDRSGSRSTLVGISLRHPSSQHGRTARYH
jgi:Ca2+-transporting ATPase